jgi:hypothetical protein
MLALRRRRGQPECDELPVTGSARHDDRAEFLAGIDLILAGMIASR